MKYILLILFIACSQTDQLRGETFTSTQTGLSYDVYYYGDLTMYQFQYKFDSIVNGAIKLEDWRPMIFIFHKDSTEGFMHYPQSNPALTDGRYKVDSVLKTNRFNNPIHSEKKIEKEVMKYFDLYEK